jgi:tRNA nucleotidyltransferase/poly(A) polymerase
MVNVNRQRWHYAAGGEPKDMIEAAIPFIYDIRQDKLELGYPGTTTHDISGQFLPGGLVEGYYEPGGKLIVQTISSWPFSFRHLADLWYSVAPQMQITSLEQLEQDGTQTKLAAEGEDVGSYIRTITAADPAAHAAWKALEGAGGRVYTVGGAVRDALLGKVPNDVDLMVGGLSPAEVHYTLSQLPGRVDETGKRFGVFRYKPPGSQADVEVALPRTSQYDSGRRGEGKITVDPELPVEKDLERRDFTANSMAVDLNDGSLIDPYGGAHDITRGVLRTTHPNSFREDPTRLVRALTAHGRFGLVPDERTRHEMEAHGHLLRGESPDALNKTIDKLFKSGNPAGAIRLGQETGVLSHLFPEVAENWDYDQQNPHHKYPLGEHLMHVLDNTSRINSDPDVRMAALYHDVGKPASAWTDPQTGEAHYYFSPEHGGQNHEDVGAKMVEDRMRSLNYPVARINRVRDLVQHHMFAPFSSDKGARTFLNRVGPHADDLLDIREADQSGKGQSPEEMAARTSADKMRQLVENSRAAQAPTNLSTLNVNGTDLINMGLRPGPAIGQILNQLMEQVLENPQTNDRETLLNSAQQLVSQQPPEAFVSA